jgi:hypothetical protein
MPVVSSSNTVSETTSINVSLHATGSGELLAALSKKQRFVEYAGYFE